MVTAFRGRRCWYVIRDFESRGRRFDSCPRNLDANRAEARASFTVNDAGQLLLVVTPGSEPGSRWFVSNSRSLQTEVIRPDEEPVLKTGGRDRDLRVRVPRLPLVGDSTYVPGVIGSTAGSNPVGQGSSPWGRAWQEAR
jgi:hypothetical protein